MTPSKQHPVDEARTFRGAGLVAFARGGVGATSQEIRAPLSREGCLPPRASRSPETLCASHAERSRLLSARDRTARGRRSLRPPEATVLPICPRISPQPVDDDRGGARVGVMFEGVATEAIHTRAEMLEWMTPWQLRRAVSAGVVARVRRDRYVIVANSAAGDAEGVMTEDVDDAVRIGGRVTCVTLLASCGVFVRESDALHVHVARNAARLGSRDLRRVRLHWGALREAAPTRHAVSLVDAVRCAVRCQSPRDAIATLDSVMNKRLMTRDEIGTLFATLPARFAVLLSLLDERAEAGTETIVRLMLRQLGAQVDLQMRIRDVGRVDLVVDGWLIVECDSKQFHEDWDSQRADRRRDVAALRQGYVTLRLLAEDILYRPDEVRRVLLDVLAHRPLHAR